MTEIIPQETSWVDEDIQRTRRKFNNRNDLLWMTEIAGPCLRSAFFHRKIRKTPPIETLRIYNSGRVLESWWIDLLHRRNEIEVIQENIPCRYINSFYRIHGRADALIQRNYGELEVHEIKTTKCFGSWLKEPKPEHVNQLQFYLNVLGIETGYIDYINKQTFINGGNIIDKQFLIQRDPGAYKNLIKRAHSLFGAIMAHIPPSKEKCWKCERYCTYKRECVDRSGDDSARAYLLSCQFLTMEAMKKSNEMLKG